MPANVDKLKNTVLNAPLKNLNQIQQSDIFYFFGFLTLVFLINVKKKYVIHKNTVVVKNTSTLKWLFGA